MAELRPRAEPFLPAETTESSQKGKISYACLSCKARRSKCSGGNPCNNCHRLNVDCVYDATQDKRRRIHWERAETEMTLQKELLGRLFDLIRTDGGEVNRQLQDDDHIQDLAQRLGMQVPEYAGLATASPPQNWPYARDTSRGPVKDDVSQRGELQKRRAMPSLDDTEQKRRAMPTIDEGVSDVAPSSRSSRSGSVDRSSIGTRLGRSNSISESTNAREQYRIFCSLNHTASKSETIRVFGDMTVPPAHVMTNYGSMTLYQQQAIDLQLPGFLVQPLLFDEERCPMAAVYTDFRDQGRRRIAEGVPRATVLGAAKIDLGLFLRERNPKDPHTPATWACEYLRLLKDVDVYVAIACIFTFARFMRWTIAPSVETYDLLPEAMRPTPLQRLVRHHPGADLAIFPQLRDGLVLDMRDYIVAIQTLGCSVNWKSGIDEAIDVDPSIQTMTVSDRFAQHICNIANWSISQRFAEVFPELHGFVHVVDQEVIHRSDVDLNNFLARQGYRNPEVDIVVAG